MRGTKILNILNNQRLMCQYCDVILKLEEQPGEVCGHFCVVAGRSKFLGGPHFTQQKTLQFSINFPLIITIKNFNCFSCLQTMMDFFYENTISTNSEHEPHIRKLAKILDVTFDLMEELGRTNAFNKIVSDDTDFVSEIFESQDEYLKTRMNATTPNLCPHCGKGFKWKQGLSSHLLIHSKEKQMLCDVCGYSTTHMKALKSHKLQHTGEFFKCTYPGCKHRSNRKENLKMHIETHKRERPFVCEVCGCKFSQNKNLKRHALKHSVAGDEAKKFKCQLCSFSSYRSDNLREHVQRLHTEKALQLELPETVENSFESKINDEFNLPEMCLMPDVCANKNFCDTPLNTKTLTVKTIIQNEGKVSASHPPTKYPSKQYPRLIAPKSLDET